MIVKGKRKLGRVGREEKKGQNGNKPLRIRRGSEVEETRVEWEKRGSKIYYVQISVSYDECDHYAYLNFTNKIIK